MNQEAFDYLWNAMSSWMTRRSLVVRCGFALGAMFPHAMCAQPTSPARDVGESPVTVFLDCGACDSVYIRTTIPWVAYVRDRTDAQVHVLETGLATGAGGTMYTMRFFGRGQFDGVDDTLQWVTAPDVTSDSVRRGLSRLLQLGLVRYVAGSMIGQRLAVTYRSPGHTDTLFADGRSIRDPWKGWIFSTGMTGYLSGQQSQTNGLVSSSIAANRTTAALKVDLGFSANNTWSNYVLPDAGLFRTRTRSYDAFGQLLHSVNEHWSVGEHIAIGNSSYDNERLWIRVAPAIEYNLFPYADATNRQFAIQSSLGMVHMQFIDTTVTNRLALTSGDWRTSVAYVATQPWGSASMTLTSAALLTDFMRQNVNVAANWNLRLAKGLSLSPRGSVSWIRTQPQLPRGELTSNEILVQQQQLATNYTYTVSLGVTYAFGSPFNTVVNPRFTTGNVLSANVGSL